MKKVYDKTITRLSEMSRACYMHATEVADEKERELWFEQGRELSDMMDKAAQRKMRKGLMELTVLSVLSRVMRKNNSVTYEVG